MSNYIQIKKQLNMLKTLFYDARHFQIAYLGSFLLAGIYILSWKSNLTNYFFIISASLLVQFIGNKLTINKKNTWKSALITSFGLCLLLHSNSISTSILASSLAIGSKFIIRYKSKHIFNPVNIGIVLSILLTQDAWISPGQWGSHYMLFFALGILGFLVLKKVDRLDAPLTFLLVFGGLQAFRSIYYLGWSTDVFIHQLSSGTLLLFTFFMITDPMTTPNHRKARIIWISIIAIGAFFLSNYMYVYAAPIWMLFVCSPLVPFLDSVFTEKKYKWNHSYSII